MQDEFGNWHSYTFGSESTGEAKKVEAVQQQHVRHPATAGGSDAVPVDDRSRSFTSLSSFGSELTMVVHTPSLSHRHRMNRMHHHHRGGGGAGSGAEGDGPASSMDGFSQNAMAGSLAGESRTSAGGQAPQASAAQRSYVSTDSPTNR